MASTTDRVHVQVGAAEFRSILAGLNPPVPRLNSRRRGYRTDERRQAWVTHPADLGTPIAMSGPFLSPTSDRAERPVASPAEKRNWVAAWTGLAIAAIARPVHAATQLRFSAGDATGRSARSDVGDRNGPLIAMGVPKSAGCVTQELMSPLVGP